MSDVEEISFVGKQPGVPAKDTRRLPAGGLGTTPLGAGARLQEFEISSVIGQGGFGIVYLARDLSLQRMVAIKEYMPAHLAGRNTDASVRPLTAGQAEVFELGRRSFINEARMLARFKHPGLLEVLRFWEQNGTAYMAMPYYDGATLTQYLKRHPGIATEGWLKLTLTPLVDALGHMHEEDCFHRDVAPDNILILKDGSAVLLDLGAARRVIAEDAQAMTVMLKPGYAPIEQYSDDPRFRQGPWTDIYAMAAVFFFGVTGKAPPASASRVMRDSVSPLSNVRLAGFSEAFLGAIDKGLSLQPEDRPRSIAEFRSLLYATEPSQPPAPNPPARRPAAKAVDRGTDPAIEDPFAPPASAASASMLVAGGLALLAIVVAGSWYAMKPALSPGNVETTLALPARSATAAPPVAAPPVAAAPVPASATAASPSVAGSTKASSAAAATIPPPPKSAAESTSASKPAAATTGTVVLAVKPWAEVRVDGVVKGVSPPLKQLTLPTGRHTIEFRNPASPPVKQQIEVRANQKATVSQQF